MDQSSSSKCLSLKLLHSQYLDLMSIYDIVYFQEHAIPKLIGAIDKDSVLAHEFVLLGLRQAAKVLDPSLNFRQKYMSVHE